MKLFNTITVLTICETCQPVPSESEKFNAHLLIHLQVTLRIEPLFAKSISHTARDGEMIGETQLY